MENMYIHNARWHQINWVLSVLVFVRDLYAICIINFTTNLRAVFHSLVTPHTHVTAYTSVTPFTQSLTAINA